MLGPKRCTACWLPLPSPRQQPAQTPSRPPPAPRVRFYGRGRGVCHHDALCSPSEAAAGAVRWQGPAQTTASSLSNASVTSSSTGSREQHLFYGRCTHLLPLCIFSFRHTSSGHKPRISKDQLRTCLYTARGGINTEKRWVHSPPSFLKHEPAPGIPR